MEEVNHKIVAVVRKMQNTQERLQAREDCFEVYRSSEQVHSQGFPYRTRPFDLKIVL